jgi:hypothetical protein
MPRTCTVCAHPDREAIDRALVESTPKRRIAAQHGLAETAVRRHQGAHLPVAVVQAQAAREVRSASELYAELERLYAETVAALERARVEKDLRAIASLVRAGREVLLLLGVALERGQHGEPQAITYSWSGCPHHGPGECEHA